MVTISVGDRIPSVTLMRMSADGPRNVDTAGLFNNHRVALFGVPGAYTPVCSSQHLPGFVAGGKTLKEKGYDLIACVSINDPFVMQAWGDDQGAVDIEMLADFRGEFTRALGLLVDLSDFGLGERSERYSMIVEDGVVVALNVESSVLEHGLSSCATLLTQS